MTTRRLVPFAGALLLAALPVAPTSQASVPVTSGVATAAADVQAPVVADDTVVITPLTYSLDVPVLANDSDPDGGNLQVCRIEAPDDSGLSVHIWSTDGEPGDGRTTSGSSYLVLEAGQELRTGTLEVTYYACDRQALAPGALTVDVRAITAAPVAGRPGVVRFTNPLDQAIEVLYGAPDGEDADGGFTVPARSTKDKRVTRSTIVWVAFPTEYPDDDGDDPWPIGYGEVRDTGARGAVPAARPSDARTTRAWRARAGAARRSTGPVGPARADEPADVPADEPADEPPVTAKDHVTVHYYDSRNVTVLANDSDDSPGELAVCRVDVPPGKGINALVEPWWAGSRRSRSDSSDRYLELSVNAAEAGTYTLTYYACDKRRLTPGTLTVTVRKFPPVTARRMSGHPGVVEFTNRGYARAVVQYFRAGTYSERYRLVVKPHSRGRVKVRYDNLDYFAYTSIGPLNDGRVRNLYP